MKSVLEIGSIPCPDPIEGIGNLTLMRLAYLVAVVAVAQIDSQTCSLLFFLYSL